MLTVMRLIITSTIKAPFSEKLPLTSRPTSNSVSAECEHLADPLTAKGLCSVPWRRGALGAIGFMRGLANDLAPCGITCNAVLPSLTDTPATSAVPESAKRSVWQNQAIKRLAQPEDIVGSVAFLASEEAGFITGQALVVDGGLYKIS